jgi:hypothetical protein
MRIRSEQTGQTSHRVSVYRTQIYTGTKPEVATLRKIARLQKLLERMEEMHRVLNQSLNNPSRSRYVPTPSEFGQL